MIRIPGMQIAPSLYGKGPAGSSREVSRTVASTEPAVRAVEQVENESGEQLLNEGSRQQTGAERLAMDGMDKDMAEVAIRAVTERTALRSQIAVLKTADRMVGTLLDVMV